MREFEEVIMVDVLIGEMVRVELKYPRDYVASLGGWWQALHFARNDGQHYRTTTESLSTTKLTLRLHAIVASRPRRQGLR